MVILKGTRVVSGIAIGKLFVYMHPDKHISRATVEDTKAEIAVFNDARQKAIDQLENLYESTVASLGELNASIFAAQEMLLEDNQYTDFVENQIREHGYNAAYAVSLASDEFSRLFTSIEDKYMRSHVADVRDVSERMLRILCGLETEMIEHDLTCVKIIRCDYAGLPRFDHLGLKTTEYPKHPLGYISYIRHMTAHVLVFY